MEENRKSDACIRIGITKGVASVEKCPTKTRVDIFQRDGESLVGVTSYFLSNNTNWGKGDKIVKVFRDRCLIQRTSINKLETALFISNSITRFLKSCNLQTDNEVVNFIKDLENGSN